jgi:hypothetical protein
MSVKNFKQNDTDIYLEILLLNEGSKSCGKLLEHKSCQFCKKSLYEQYSIELKCKHIYHRNCIIKHMLDESKYECPECVLNESSDEDFDLPTEFISSDEEDKKEDSEYIIQDNDCKICFEDIEEKKEEHECNKCKMKFHKSCYDECIQKMRTNKCPLCQFKDNIQQREQYMHQDEEDILMTHFEDDIPPVA